MRRVVLLPGINESPNRVRDAGFADAVRERDACVELQFAAYEFEELADRAVATRLAERILTPDPTPAAARPWLAGISLGGYVALQCARLHPSAVAGVCLIAPYLGGRALLAEIARARGVASWCPGAPAPDDDDRALWLYLKEGAGGVPLYLGGGTGDRFAQGHALLAPLLPRSRLHFVDGGHDWPTWRRIWDAFLESECWR
ncbi:MAG TPA: alpha/beta hydrolase-fold protein [Steroidobacteraceae bacterium]|nr:alpha/beta hydrolase-fold protein [Steroidobacteraceae bacterium]